MKKYVFSIILFALTSFVFSVNLNLDQKKSNSELKTYLLPISLIGYSAIGINNKNLRHFNHQIRSYVENHFSQKIPLDDYLQYSPAIAVYSLDLVGLKSKHNILDQTKIYFYSSVIMGIAVNSLKYSLKYPRPDGSSKNSLPSGHTATAFVSAEFLSMEFSHQSKWIGTASYLTAISVASLRIINNRHWLTDITAGAGIGIISFKLGNLVFEKFSNKKKRKPSVFSLIPFYNVSNQNFGLALNF